MKLEPARFQRIVLFCADCEKRNNGPRDLDSKSSVKRLRHLTADAPVRIKAVRTRCMGLCPRKALAAVACSERSAPLAAEVATPDDMDQLAHELLRPVRR